MSAPDRRTLVVAGMAVVASGTLFFLGVGQAIVPVAAATWLAPLPVLLVAPRVPGRAAFAAAFAAYLLGTANSWGFFARSHDVPLQIGVPISLCQALTFAAVVWVFRRLLVRGHAVTAVVTGPAVWVSLVFLVQFVEPYGMVGTLAEQLSSPLPLQVASVTGGLGVDFLVLLGACAVAALRVRALVVGAVVLAVAFGFGALRLATGTGGESSQRVALVVSNPTIWGPDVATPEGRTLLDGYVQQVATLPAGVDIAVLPEGALTVDSTTLPTVEAAFARVARERGTAVVVGITRNADGHKYANALVVPASGTPPQLYLKHHDRVSPAGHDLTFVPGTLTATGVLICADANFSDVARAYGRAAAGLVVMPSSDNVDNGWVHARTGALRGIENGFAVAWPGQQGNLLIADRSGNVLAEATSRSPAPFTTVVADVPVAPDATIYNRLGGWFPWSCVALVLIGMAATVRRVRAPARDRDGPPPSATITARALPTTHPSVERAPDSATLPGPQPTASRPISRGGK